MIVLPQCLGEHAEVRPVHCGIRWKHVGVWESRRVGWGEGVHPEEYKQHITVLLPYLRREYMMCCTKTGHYPNHRRINSRWCSRNFHWLQHYEFTGICAVTHLTHMQTPFEAPYEPLFKMHALCHFLEDCWHSCWNIYSLFHLLMQALSSFPLPTQG